VDQWWPQEIRDIDDPAEIAGYRALPGFTVRQGADKDARPADDATDTPESTPAADETAAPADDQSHDQDQEGGAA
jgi:hypothetical protein